MKARLLGWQRVCLARILDSERAFRPPEPPAPERFRLLNGTSYRQEGLGPRRFGMRAELFPFVFQRHRQSYDHAPNGDLPLLTQFRQRVQGEGAEPNLPLKGQATRRGRPFGAEDNA